MKKTLVLLVATAWIGGLNYAAFAQVDAGVISKFVDSAKASSDSQLGSIASELTGKVQALATSSPALKTALESTIKSLTGGMDSGALTSAYNLAKDAKLTPEQLGLAKEVGNLTSAYAVQKNFSSLEGSQSDVANIVSSLRKGNVTEAIPSIKNVAGNAHLTDGQKHLITTVGNKYVPGWEKAKGAMDGLKKLPSF
jgi:hypothetical protein